MRCAGVQDELRAELREASAAENRLTLELETEVEIALETGQARIDELETRLSESIAAGADTVVELKAVRTQWGDELRSVNAQLSHMKRDYSHLEGDYEASCSANRHLTGKLNTAESALHRLQNA